MTFVFVKVLGKFWTVLCVRSVLSKLVRQQFTSVTNVYKIVLLTAGCVDDIFCFAVTSIFQLDRDVLLGVGESGCFCMSLQSMQEPHSDVEVGFFVGVLMSFLTGLLQIILGRRNATVGG